MSRDQVFGLCQGPVTGQELSLKRHNSSLRLAGTCFQFQGLGYCFLTGLALKFTLSLSHH